MPHILSTIHENYEDHPKPIPTSDSSSVSTDDELFLNNLNLSDTTSSSSGPDAKPIESPLLTAPKKQPRVAKNAARPQKATKENEVEVSAKKAEPKKKETKAASEPQASTSSAPESKKVHESAMVSLYSVYFINRHVLSQLCLFWNLKIFPINEFNILLNNIWLLIGTKFIYVS